MKQPIVSTGALGWKEINANADFRMEIQIAEPGIVEIDLLAKSESDWRVADYESAVLRIWVEREYNQDCVLFYGNRPLTYTRLLGYMQPGTYMLRFAFNPDISSPQVKKAYIESVDVKIITEKNSELFEIYKHTPVIYGRNVYHPYEGRYTDTPLLMFYCIEPLESGKAIEYQMMFSHEDEGTPTPLLMSKWGRTTDIEWVYRVEIDEQGEVQKATFQGPEHVTGEFKGSTALGGHPVLQNATTNGMVHDTITSRYRFLLPAVYEWNQQIEPRERVMDAFPFTYQVTAWEMLRQYSMEQPVVNNSFQLTDLRNYLYVQSAKVTENPQKETSIDIQVKLKGVKGWFSGSFGDLRYGEFRCAYDGPYFQFSTTVKLPAGTCYNDIEEICAVWLPDGEESVMVPEFKGFFLDEDYAPQQPIRSSAEVTVTKEQPRQTLWRGDGQ
ncbi:hypothetical protein [Paenibacillus radicis (ex Xue et al. 2023)]|uniref:Uncharacterized protein n=1 Tax=Paenibacillus radicis (ex Xue et al. 2023) TaxID=2972489 RepID=A0ABT1YPB1_9BACL|nr:hypothetical protein [Paenibacillus radicis (ex Xue et al. 2023)]MCR8635018.1 hypothetical protein [Paenibacillus radicis (ex Xue et al. 2023)]